MDVPIFDDRLDYSESLRDHQVFLNWLHNMNVYFHRYSLSEAVKIRFAATKRTGKASEYWTDVAKDEYSMTNMEEVLTNKYEPPYFDNHQRAPPICPAS